jgi:hypothetical protein
MKTTTKNTGIKVNAGVKAGAIGYNNHTQSGLKVRAGIKAGATLCQWNHNVRLIALG